MSLTSDLELSEVYSINAKDLDIYYRLLPERCESIEVYNRKYDYFFPPLFYSFRFDGSGMSFLFRRIILYRLAI